MGTAATHPLGGVIDVHRGPALLAGACDPRGLDAHRHRHGALPALTAEEIEELCTGVELSGRGGAGFPFARKLAMAKQSRGRVVVVVNLSEGEPGSLKDAALAQVAPHLVLDGAVAVARALGGREIHLAVPGESPVVADAMAVALDERQDRHVRWSMHRTAPRFVSGQAAAVLELLAGRPNLPVTTRQPAAASGHRGRPTLLSNAETFAHLGWLVLHGAPAYGALGAAGEPGTTLLTLDGDRRQSAPPTVREVALGSPWSTVLHGHRLQRPVLLGGYHGTWTRPGALQRMTISRRSPGPALGAGVVLPQDEGCPLDRTAEIVGYLAAESAGRCGPCHHGLPALAAVLGAVARGEHDATEVERLSALVEGRGACAHPTGTVRLVRSLLTAFPDEPARHAAGVCGFGVEEQEESA